jgi:hypothetical protein
LSFVKIAILFSNSVTYSITIITTITTNFDSYESVDGLAFSTVVLVIPSPVLSLRLERNENCGRRLFAMDVTKNIITENRNQISIAKIIAIYSSLEEKITLLSKISP